MSFDTQNQSTDRSAAVRQDIDQAIERALKDKLPFLSSTELMDESFKSDIVEKAVVFLMEEHLGKFRPKDIRPLVIDRIDWCILRHIQNDTHGEKTTEKRVLEFLKPFALG